jgi:hypothetical protein
LGTGNSEENTNLPFQGISVIIGKEKQKVMQNSFFSIRLVRLAGNALLAFAGIMLSGG